MIKSPITFEVDQDLLYLKPSNSVLQNRLLSFLNVLILNFQNKKRKGVNIFKIILIHYEKIYYTTIIYILEDYYFFAKIIKIYQ